MSRSHHNMIYFVLDSTCPKWRWEMHRELQIGRVYRGECHCS